MIYNIYFYEVCIYMLRVNGWLKNLGFLGWVENVNSNNGSVGVCTFHVFMGWRISWQ
jgi:hypothetical protein